MGDAKMSLEGHDEFDRLRREEKEEYDDEVAEVKQKLEATVETMERYRREAEHIRAEQEELKRGAPLLLLAGLVSQLNDRDTAREAGDNQSIALDLSHDIVYYLTCSPDVMPLMPNRYAKTMRRTVRLLLDKHSSVFETMLENIILSDVNGPEVIQRVADELFRIGDKNWGRVVTLYALGGFLARHAMKNRMRTVTVEIGDCIGTYTANNLGEWIAMKGGWGDFERFFADSRGDGHSWKSLLLIALGLGTLVALASI